MQVHKPCRQQLINAIVLLAQGTPVTLSQVAFTTDGPLPTPAALKITAFHQDFALECKDYCFLHFFKEFASLNTQTVSPYILQGVLELFIGGLITKFNAATKSAVAITDYIVPFDASPYTESVSFTLTFREEHIPFVLYFPSSEAMRALLDALSPFVQQKCSAEPATATTALLHSVLEFVVGRSHLTLDELKTLEVGDALIVEECFVDQDVVQLRCGKYAAWSKVQGKQVQVHSAFLPWMDEDIVRMSDDVKDAESGAEDAAQPLVSSLGDLKLELCFELERRQMSVDEIRALGVGTLVDLQNVDLSAVDVVVNNQVIARGRIIDVDERFALQLTEMCSCDK